MNKNDILNNIKTKLNNESYFIKEYYSNFKFNIKQGSRGFFYTFFEKNILSYHSEIKIIFDSKNKNFTIYYSNISINPCSSIN